MFMDEDRLFTLLKKEFGEEAFDYNDVANIVPRYSRARVYQLIKSMIDNKKISRLCKGLYCVYGETFYGQEVIDARKVIEKRFIREGEEVYGYYSGAVILNNLGIKNDVPVVIEVVSNREKTRIRDLNICNLRVRVRKARVEINKENYKVLQVLEVLKSVNLQKIKDKKKILRKFIMKNVDDEIVLNFYAEQFPKRAISNYKELINQ